MGPDSAAPLPGSSRPLRAFTGGAALASLAAAETFTLCSFQSRWGDSKPPHVCPLLGLGSGTGKGPPGWGSPCTATVPPAAPTAPSGVSPPWEAEWVRVVPSVWGYWAVRVWGTPGRGSGEVLGWVGSRAGGPRLTGARHPPQRVGNGKPLGASTGGR